MRGSALDKLRREIHCASDGHAAERLPGVDGHDHARKLLPDDRRSATTVTWCTKDKNGAHRRSPARSRTRSGGTSARRARAPGRRGRRTSWTTRRASPPARSSTLTRPGRVAHSATTGGRSRREPTRTTSRRSASGAEVPGDGRLRHDRCELTSHRQLVGLLRARRRTTSTAATATACACCRNVTVRHLVRRLRPDHAHGQPADAAERRRSTSRARRTSTRARTRSPSAPSGRRHVHRHDVDDLHGLHRRPGRPVPAEHAGLQRVERAAASRERWR